MTCPSNPIALMHCRCVNLPVRGEAGRTCGHSAGEGMPFGHAGKHRLLQRGAHLMAQVVWPTEPSRQESSTETRMQTLGSAFLVKPAQMARSTSV